MTMLADPPAPPAGFTIDSSSPSPPPPPAGFTLDGPKASAPAAPPPPPDGFTVDAPPAKEPTPEAWLSQRMQQGVTSHDELKSVLQEYHQRGGNLQSPDYIGQQNADNQKVADEGKQVDDFEQQFQNQMNQFHLWALQNAPEMSPDLMARMQESAALKAKGESPVGAGLRSAGNAFSGFTESLLPGGSIYGQTEALQRQVDQQARNEASPVSSTVGRFAGGIVAPESVAAGAVGGELLKPIIGETPGLIAAARSGSAGRVLGMAQNAAINNAVGAAMLTAAAQLNAGKIDPDEFIHQVATAAAQGPLQHAAIGTPLEIAHLLAGHGIAPEHAPYTEPKGAVSEPSPAPESAAAAPAQATPSAAPDAAVPPDVTPAPAINPLAQHIADLDTMQTRADALLKQKSVAGALESPKGKLPNDTSLAPSAPSAPAPPTTADRVAMKQELTSRPYPEGAPVHGTDISALPSIAEDGLQPGKTYQQGGSSDEGAVYGSKVKNGDPGLAASYAASKSPNLPAILVLKQGMEGDEVGPGNYTLHSRNALGGRASYVRPEDIAKVVIPGQPDMTLPEATAFAKKYMAGKSSTPSAENGGGDGRFDLSGTPTSLEAISGLESEKMASQSSAPAEGAGKAVSGVPTPLESANKGPISGEPAPAATGEGFAKAGGKGGLGRPKASAAPTTPTGGGAEYGQNRPTPESESTKSPTPQDKEIQRQYSRRQVEGKLQDWIEQRDNDAGRNTLPSVFDADGSARQIEHPVIPPDALDGASPTDKARLSKYVDEDEWSNITAGKSAQQIDALQSEMMRRLTETKKGRLDRAIDEAKSSDDPRAQFLAHYYENTPPFGEKLPKEWLDAGKLTEDDVGKSFEIHGEKFRVDTDDEGSLVLKDHITIRNPEELGKIPVDKGSVKEPEEAEVGDEPLNPDEAAPAKTTGQQKGLLGEASDGGITGAKSGSLFGNTSRGAASALEAQGNEVGQSAKEKSALDIARGFEEPLTAHPRRTQKQIESLPTPTLAKIASERLARGDVDTIVRQELARRFDNELTTKIVNGLHTSPFLNDFGGWRKLEAAKYGETAEMFPADKEKGELAVGDKMPIVGWKPADHPTVTDVRMTPEGTRQYQVKFSKGEPQWLPAPKPIADAAIGNPMIDENAKGFGDTSISAAVDAAAVAQAKARAAAAAKAPQSLLGHAASSLADLLKKPAQMLGNFRSRFAFLGQQYGAEGTKLVKPLSEYISSLKSGKYAGGVEAERVLKGLSEDQRSQFNSLGMDGRRQIENMGVAKRFANEIAPEPKNKAPNKLAATLSGSNPNGPNAAIRKAVFNALDEPGTFDKDTLASHLVANLVKVDPMFVTKWADAAAKDPQFSLETMAAEEGRRANELMKLDDAGRKAILADPKIAAAIDRFKTGTEPTLLELRQKNKMPIDPNWNKVPLALNFEQDYSGRAFEPSSGIRMSDPYSNEGQGKERLTDPTQTLANIVSRHFAKDRENAALDAVAKSKLVTPEDQVHIADDGKNSGKFVAMVQGKETPMEMYNLSRDRAKPDEKWIPSNLKKELDTLNAAQRPDLPGIGGFLLGMKLKGIAAIHAANALTKSSAELASQGAPRLENLAPWIGARIGTAFRGVRDALSPVGQMHQLLLNDFGASGTRGFNTTHLEGFPETAKEWATKAYGIDHDVLFAPKYGAENVLRGQLLDSILSAKLGNRYTSLREQVRGGKVTPVEAMRKVSAMAGPSTYQDSQAFVNDTLGWLDRDQRGEKMNRAQPLLTFIGVEASSLPGNIRRLLTANMDLPGIAKMVKGGDMKGAAVKAAQGIMAGPVGAFALANAVNYAINGKLMKDNDDGHKLDVHLGGGWYIGFDAMIQQAARLTGLKDFAEGKIGSLKDWAGAVAGHAASEMSSIINPVYTNAVSALTSAYEAMSGKKAHFSFNTGRAYSVPMSANAPVPYLTNTVHALASGQNVTAGAAKDAAADVTGQNLTVDDQTPDQKALAERSSAIDKAVAGQPAQAAGGKNAFQIGQGAAYKKMDAAASKLWQIANASGSKADFDQVVKAELEPALFQTMKMGESAKQKNAALYYAIRRSGLTDATLKKYGY